MYRTCCESGRGRGRGEKELTLDAESLVAAGPLRAAKAPAHPPRLRVHAVRHLVREIGGPFGQRQEHAAYFFRVREFFFQVGLVRPRGWRKKGGWGSAYLPYAMLRGTVDMRNQDVSYIAPLRLFSMKKGNKDSHAVPTGLGCPPGTGSRCG